MYFEHVCTESLHVTDMRGLCMCMHAYARMSSVCMCSKQMTPTSGEGSRCRLTVNCAVLRYAARLHYHLHRICNIQNTILRNFEMLQTRFVIRA